MSVASLSPIGLHALWRLMLLMAAMSLGASALAAAEAAVEEPAAPPVAEAEEADKPADPPAVAARQVALVKLRLPITGNDDTIYQARLQRAIDQLHAGPAGEGDRRPLLVIEFAPSQEGGATEFERALRLARFLVSDEMARVKTLAYLPHTVEGHAVLVALACEEIAMAPEAQLGRAGADEDNARPLEPGIRASYEQIAEARRTAPPAVVLAMVDRAAELVRLETDRGVEYALGSDLESLREERAVVSEDVLAPAGTLAVFTGREAREEGIAKYLVPDREALARALAVPSEALNEDQSIAGEWRPVMVDLSGPVNHRIVRRIETLIGDELERNQTNWVGVRIDSVGGDLPAALRLAQTLADLGDGEVRTVAYVPKRAEGPAALVALACDQLVMQDGSVLRGLEPIAQDDPGGAGKLKRDLEKELEGLIANPQAEIDAARLTVRETIAPATSRTWSLLAATFDANLELARYTNRETGAERIFCPDELEEQPAAAEWRKGEAVKAAGVAFEVPADGAVASGVAWQTVGQFDDLQAIYGLTEAPRTSEPNWALELVEALSSPGLAALLLVIGIVGIYIELHTPGVGLGGFVATVALLLFFWSKFLNGTADWLEVLLFVTGLVFVLLELLVLPGVGVFGVGGSLLMIASLVLASQTFILPQTETQLFELRNSLATVAGAGFGFLILAGVLRHYLPQSTLFRRATLAPLEEADRIELERREQLADYEYLLGHSGVATTNLMPSGRVEIDGELVDVVTRGELIDRGETVEVIETHANRVVVRRMS
jgi:membrane-bound serine protease (ClpP class)